MITRIIATLCALALSLAAQTAGGSAARKAAAGAKETTSAAPKGLKDVDSKDIKLGVDEPGCVDPGLLPRVAGCSIIQCDKRDFGTRQLHVGASAEGVVDTEAMEGPLEVIYYICPSKVSLASIVKQSESALVKGGFRPVYSGKDEDDQPVTTVSKDSQFVEISTYPYEQYSAYVFTSVEALPEITSELLAEELAKSGRVILDALAFEKERAELPTNAEKILAEVATLLSEKPEWKLKIEGHTADAADKQNNLDLSQKRASAVAAWLTEHGVDQSRVSTEGLGDTKVTTETKTRIELVKF